MTTEVKVGQVWEALRGKGRLKIVAGAPPNELRARSLLEPGAPAISIDPERFVQHHRLVGEADGSSVVPPAPPPFDPKPGDVVCLKCGGPPMVVTQTAGGFNERARARYEEFGGEKGGGGWLGLRPAEMDADEVMVTWHKDNGELTSATLLKVALVQAAEAFVANVTEHFDRDKMIEAIERRMNE